MWDALRIVQGVGHADSRCNPNVVPNRKLGHFQAGRTRAARHSNCAMTVTRARSGEAHGGRTLRVIAAAAVLRPQLVSTR